MTSYYDDLSVQVFHGDALTVLMELPDDSVQCCVTSPPYWGLRDYQTEGQIGLEPTPEAYVAVMVGIFREVRRVLRKDGTLWLNLGDSYASNWPCNRRNVVGEGSLPNGKREARPPRMGADLKDKDLVGIPWRVAFALRADGWWLRSDIIWSKPNPMPESVTDRPTKAHEYVFLMTKSANYYYDAEAMKEPCQPANYKTPDGWDTSTGAGGHGAFHKNGREKGVYNKSGNLERKIDIDPSVLNEHRGASIPWEGWFRNRRTVWEIATQPYPDAHFATFPPKLIEPCVLAGSKEGDTILDPFSGAGTALMVAKNLGRRAIGIELNAAYIDLSASRLAQEVLL